MVATTTLSGLDIELFTDASGKTFALGIQQLFVSGFPGIHYLFKAGLMELSDLG